MQTFIPTPEGWGIARPSRAIRVDTAREAMISDLLVPGALRRYRAREGMRNRK